MPQKKKVVKKDIKKVVKNVVKNTKQQPILKNSINIKIDLDDDEKKKKPKRKKRQPAKTKEQTDNNVSYVDEQGKPISNEIINNRSFSRSFMPQPFSRNSTVIGTSFNESAIMDRVMEKMSKLNASNQSMNQSINNSVLNQSTAVPAPPQLPRPARAYPPPSTIAPASPSVAPQSLNFNFSSPPRPVGMTPLQASSMALNRIQQLGIDSGKAATDTQEAIAKLFQGVEDLEQAEIKRATDYVRTTKYTELMKVPIGGARKGRFKTLFKETYTGTMYPEDAAELGYGYTKLALGI
jgi:hypothetical protein